MKTYKVYIRNKAKADIIYVSAFTPADIKLKVFARYPKASINDIVEMNKKEQKE